MAEGTYEYECARAELLGVEPPNRDDFEAAAAAARSPETTEVEALLETEVNLEKLKENSGKLDELNGILSITQQRLSKLKGACGSLTNLLKLRRSSRDVSVDAVDGQQQATDAAVNGGEQAAQPQQTVDGALDTLDAMKDEEARTDVQVMRSAATDMRQKMACQFDALDSMLSKAESAEYAMNQQNRDMKRILKK